MVCLEACLNSGELLHLPYLNTSSPRWETGGGVTKSGGGTSRGSVAERECMVGVVCCRGGVFQGCCVRAGVW